jgi:hypothetical protein
MPEKRLLPDRKVAQRYGVCLRTLWRWDRNPRLGFPRPVTINKRHYRIEAELDAFDRARSAGAQDDQSR